MGNTPSEVSYSIAISEKTAGESAIYRHPLSSDSLVTTPNADVHTMQDALLKAFYRFTDRPCMGERGISSKSTLPADRHTNGENGVSAIRGGRSENLTQSGVSEFGGAQSLFEKDNRIQTIMRSTQLSFTEKQHLTEVENQKFQLERQAQSKLLQQGRLQNQIATSQSTYRWRTYGYLHASSRNLATSITFFNLAEQSDEQGYLGAPLNLIGIWSRTRPEWLVVDTANVLYGNVTVPIPETSNALELSQILDDTRISTLFCGLDGLHRLVSQANLVVINKYRSLSALLTLIFCPMTLSFMKQIRMYKDHLAEGQQIISSQLSLGNLKTIVCFDDNIPPTIETVIVSELNISIFTLHHLIERGANLPQIPLPRISPDQVLSLSFTTSEEDGRLKAAKLTHRNFVSYLGSIWNISSLRPMPTDVYLSFLPLHHVYEKSVVFAALFAGASIGFSQGQTETLIDDLANLRPTILCSVPAFYNKLFASVTKKYFGQTSTGISRWINEQALESKLASYKSSSNADLKSFFYDNLVFSEARQSLGGALRIAFSASAPLYPHVQQLLKLVYGIPILQAYGCTQSTGLAFISNPLDTTEGHVGGPTLSTEFKIIDVIELNYSTEDKDQFGMRMVRGELCLRGPGIFDGFFKDVVATSKCIDKNGWFHTGDIVQLLPNGAIQIIDRLKHIFKISQGEYVSPAKLERVYSQCLSVSDIFVFGSPFQKYLVAVLVPKKDFVDDCAKQFSLPSITYADNCQNPYVQEQILLDLRETARKNKLHQYEWISKIWVELTPFSVLGLTMPNNSLKRNKASKHFGIQIQKLFQ